MRRLLISFVFTLLTAQTAYALESQADHAVKLIKSFEADKVDHVINESVGKIKCGEGTNNVAKSEPTLSDDHPIQGPGRAPAIEGNGKTKFDLFREKVEKGEFRKAFYKEEGDTYHYVTQKSEEKPLMGGMLEMRETTNEHAFYRHSETKNQPFFHELGLSKEEVKKSILKLLDNSDESFQVDEKAFAIRVGEKAYLIDLRLPLIANPIYKQDVSSGDFDYGFTNVTPREKQPSIDELQNISFVSPTE